ncbi:hypothetical protein ACOYR4_12865 [Acidovorax sp. M14]|uniref:hypothetical protein n=1 Tax=Acidovorax sp. M14 TaxID=3411354 RepID=UPI003BF48977
MRIEILDGETVINTILADEEFAEQHYPGAWRVAAVQDEPTSPPPHITKLAFRNRFTRAEKVAIEMAALDNPAAPLAQRQQAAALRADLKDQQDATYIDLARADLQAGVQALEAAGLLAAGRAEQILTAPITDIERYKGP